MADRADDHDRAVGQRAAHVGDRTRRPIASERLMTSIGTSTVSDGPEAGSEDVGDLLVGGPARAEVDGEDLLHEDPGAERSRAGRPRAGGGCSRSGRGRDLPGEHVCRVAATQLNRKNTSRMTQLVRAAGTEAQLLGKEERYVVIRLSSGEMRKVLKNCRATIGSVGNQDHELIKIGKAGRSRWLGKRPTVRGVVMNPVDHPHGGGEGRAPIGRKSPLSPWGKPTLGYKTRKKNKASDKYIVRRRTK